MPNSPLFEPVRLGALRLGAPLNRYDRSTFYGGDAYGYVDDPALQASKPTA